MATCLKCQYDEPEIYFSSAREAFDSFVEVFGEFEREFDLEQLWEETDRFIAECDECERIFQLLEDLELAIAIQGYALQAYATAEAAFDAEVPTQLGRTDHYDVAAMREVAEEFVYYGPSGFYYRLPDAELWELAQQCELPAREAASEALDQLVDGTGSATTPDSMTQAGWVPVDGSRPAEAVGYVAGNAVHMGGDLPRRFVEAVL